MQAARSKFARQNKARNGMRDGSETENSKRSIMFDPLLFFILHVFASLFSFILVAGGEGSAVGVGGQGLEKVLF